MKEGITGRFYLFILLFGICFFSLLNFAVDGLVEQCRRDFEEGEERKRRRQPVRYVIIGLTGGIAALLCSHYAGETVREGILTFLFLGVLIITAAVDQETMEIPDCLPAAVLILSAASLLFKPDGLLELSAASRVIGFFSVSIPMLLTALAIPGAFGGGDIKLMAACGMFLGWKRNLLALFLAVLGGGGWGAWLLIRKRASKKDVFAFGPFLCAGMAVSLFWGQRLIQWYLGIMRQTVH